MDPLASGHPLLSQVAKVRKLIHLYLSAKEITLSKICAYIPAPQNSPDMAKLVAALPSEGITYYHIYDREDLDKALLQFTDRPHYPKIFVEGKYLAGCERLYACCQFDELRNLITQSLHVSINFYFI